MIKSFQPWFSVFLQFAENCKFFFVLLLKQCCTKILVFAIVKTDLTLKCFFRKLLRGPKARGAKSRKYEKNLSLMNSGKMHIIRSTTTFHNSEEKECYCCRVLTVRTNFKFFLFQGGCGIIAGWGGKYDDLIKTDEFCSTAPNTFFPGRAKVCEISWSLEGKRVHHNECILKKPLPLDFETPCKVFH